MACEFVVLLCLYDGVMSEVRNRSCRLVLLLWHTRLRNLLMNVRSSRPCRFTVILRPRRLMMVCLITVWLRVMFGLFVICVHVRPISLMVDRLMYVMLVLLGLLVFIRILLTLMTLRFLCRRRIVRTLRANMTLTRRRLSLILLLRIISCRRLITVIMILLRRRLRFWLRLLKSRLRSRLMVTLGFLRYLFLFTRVLDLFLWRAVKLRTLFALVMRLVRLCVRLARLRCRIIIVRVRD